MHKDIKKKFFLFFSLFETEMVDHKFLHAEYQ